MKDFDDSTPRWFHYAWRRLPLSLAISIITLAVAALLIWLGVVLCRFILQ